MIVTFNGRASQTKGQRPRKPVRWTGTFLVADDQGNALEAKWKTESGPLMTYQEAQPAAIELIETLAQQVQETHGRPIKKVTFTLMSR